MPVEPPNVNTVNRVLLTLVVVAATACFMPFVSAAPNRLISGQAVGVFEALTAWQIGMLITSFSTIAFAATPFGRSPRTARTLVLVGALIGLLVVVHSAGAFAARSASPGAPARVSLGAGFWVLASCALLAMVDTFQRFGNGLIVKPVYAGTVGIGVGALFVGGHMDSLSIMREYANNRDAFASELFAHLGLVSAALGPTIALGVPLGLVATRNARWRGGLFAVLNVLQTIPSIALFALLLAPLSALGDAFPFLKDVGVKGIGAAPAVIALVLYSLLPAARNTYAGFAGVATSVIDAARGMGMTPRQVLWLVEVPLALPVIFMGFRIVVVQAIGLTVVAALIGAGGLGRFIFQGLGQYAVDLVLLGAVPTILLAVAADFVMQIPIVLSRRGAHP